MGADRDGWTWQDLVFASYKCSSTLSNARLWYFVGLIDEREHNTSISRICICRTASVQKTADVSIRSYGKAVGETDRTIRGALVETPKYIRPTRIFTHSEREAEGVKRPAQI